MTAKEDYSSLVHGLCSLDFSGDNIPCQLLLTGDTAFPLLVTPAQHVLLAASKYGKGKIVVMSHEAYLNQPQFMDFLKNAISWLKPSLEAVIGVNNNLDHLEQTLSSSGHRVEKVSGLKKDLGVFCTTGYDDSQAEDIVTFLSQGGGVLIGAQAWYWSQFQQQENVLCHFPGNKITSVSGLQEGFGWNPFKSLFAEYQKLSNVSRNNLDKMNLWAEKFSQAVNKNLAPFFQSWGWPIEEKTRQKLTTLPMWEENPMKKYISSD
ncbi:hypothetical protein AB205_0090250, partial [Aquarana catesbeiana]